MFEMLNDDVWCTSYVDGSCSKQHNIIAIVLKTAMFPPSRQTTHTIDEYF